MVEPEVSDLQLTVDTLKTTIRDAQRTITELRAELDARRQELADVQIARAQMEGRLREAERRLAEARHVIDLQREELAGSRAERERVARAGAALHGQLKQLQKQLSKVGKQSPESRPGIAPANLPASGRRTASVKSEPSQSTESVAPAVVQPAFHQEESPVGIPPRVAAPSRVLVKPGDTLWSLAQRHHVTVKRLMSLNGLADTRIEVGQALWLSGPPALEESQNYPTP
jgi:LysM repeat protein